MSVNLTMKRGEKFEKKLDDWCFEATMYGFYPGYIIKLLDKNRYLNNCWCETVELKDGGLGLVPLDDYGKPLTKSKIKKLAIPDSCKEPMINSLKSQGYATRLFPKRRPQSENDDYDPVRVLVAALRYESSPTGRGKETIYQIVWREPIHVIKRNPETGEKIIKQDWLAQQPEDFDREFDNIPDYAYESETYYSIGNAEEREQYRLAREEEQRCIELEKTLYKKYREDNKLDEQYYSPFFTANHGITFDEITRSHLSQEDQKLLADYCNGLGPYQNEIIDARQLKQWCQDKGANWPVVKEILHQMNKTFWEARAWADVYGG